LIREGCFAEKMGRWSTGGDMGLIMTAMIPVGSKYRLFLTEWNYLEEIGAERLLGKNLFVSIRGDETMWIMRELSILDLCYNSPQEITSLSPLLPQLKVLTSNNKSPTLNLKHGQLWIMIQLSMIYSFLLFLFLNKLNYKR